MDEKMDIEYLRDCPPSPPDSGYISPTCFSSVKQSYDFRSRFSSLSSERQLRGMEAWPTTRRRLSCKYPLTPVSITDSYQDRSCFDEFSSLHDSSAFSMCLRSHGLRTSDILLTPPSPTLDNLAHQSLTDVEMLLPESSTPVSPTSSKVQSMNCRLRSRLSDGIKPRNLNLGTKPRRALPDFTGRETVDILGNLGDKSHHTVVVSKILGYLSPQDLCACSMVSKIWQRVLLSDTKAKTRYLNNILTRHHLKENLAKVKSAKKDGSQEPTSPKIRYARKGLFVQVQNLPEEPQKPLNSPPVSPSKVKFHSYVKASRTLAPTEHLLRCPKCSFASHVNSEMNVAVCSRTSCSMEFCTSCLSNKHPGPCQMPLLATPTEKRPKPLIIGSRQSKRNLRRL